MRILILLFVVTLVAIGCHQPPAESIDDTLIVFPNPAVQQANVIVKNQGAQFSLKAFNNKGEELTLKPGSPSEFSITLTESGTYYIVLTINNKKITREVIRL